MRLLRRNTLGVYGAWGVAIVSGLVVTPVTYNALGKTEFGLWKWIGSITIFLALLDFGVGPSIVRFAAAYRGRRSVEETNALASTGLVVYGLIGLVSIPVGLALVWAVPYLIDIPGELDGEARAATALIVLGLVLRFPLGLFGSLLVGQHRFDVQNLGNALSLIVYTALVAIVLPRGGGIVLLSAFALLATMIRLVVPLFWLRRELPELRIRRSYVTRERLRELGGFSGSNFLVHVSSKVVFSTDVVVVGIVLGPVAAALYAIPATLFSIAFGVATAGPSLLYPAFAELEGAAEIERQRRLVLVALRIGMAFMLLLALPLLFMPDQLIDAWIGSVESESAVVLALLALVLIVHQPIFLLTQYLVARGMQHRVALTLTVAAALNLALSVALATTVGLWGVALSTLLLDCAALAYIVVAIAAPAAATPVSQLVRVSLRPFAPALVSALVVLVLVDRLFEPDTLLTLAPIGALWVVAATGSMWRFGISGDERALIRAQVGSRRAGPREQDAISQPL
jgi:O-antigen/teichoic acid export membrane protein